MTFPDPRPIWRLGYSLAWAGLLITVPRTLIDLPDWLEVVSVVAFLILIALAAGLILRAEGGWRPSRRLAAERTADLDPLSPDERYIGPVLAFGEMKELAFAGSYGWHSVEAGVLHHRVVASTTQWEHRRMLTFRPPAPADGWQIVSTQPGIVYLKRDQGVPALEEP